VFFEATTIRAFIASCKNMEIQKEGKFTAYERMIHNSLDPCFSLKGITDKGILVSLNMVMIREEAT
jgi:hypothetical protein